MLGAWGNGGVISPGLSRPVVSVEPKGHEILIPLKNSEPNS
jgi:hypothetical protein